MFYCHEVKTCCIRWYLSLVENVCNFFFKLFHFLKFFEEQYSPYVGRPPLLQGWSACSDAFFCWKCFCLKIISGSKGININDSHWLEPTQTQLLLRDYEKDYFNSSQQSSMQQGACKFSLWHKDIISTQVLYCTTHLNIRLWNSITLDLKTLPRREWCAGASVVLCPI